MDPSSWLRHAFGDMPAAVRLLCLPHAGGGASAFNAWRDRLPGWIELVKVQLPGREDRLESPPHTSMAELLPQLFVHLEALLDKPLLVYGQSMGAIIAFEVSRELRRRGCRMPEALLISGRRAPHRLLRAGQMLHTLPDDALAARLEALGGIPPGLFASKKWRSHYFPTIRADLCVSDEYAYDEAPPLECPIHAFVGETDDLVVREDWEAWAAQAVGEFTCRVLPGGHFFSRAGWGELLAHVVAVAERTPGSPRSCAGSRRRVDAPVRGHTMAGEEI